MTSLEMYNAVLTRAETYADKYKVPAVKRGPKGDAYLRAVRRGVSIYRTMPALLAEIEYALAVVAKVA
jgi:hypothetical protein